MFTLLAKRSHTMREMAPVKRNGQSVRSESLYRNCTEVIMFNTPIVDLVATGKNIERLRKEAGYSVKELQSIFGFATPQAIYKWQHGAALPTVDNLVVLSAIFHVSINEILVVDKCDGAMLVVSA